MTVFDPPRVPDLSSRQRSDLRAHLIAELDGSPTVVIPIARRRKRIAVLLATAAAISVGSYVAIVDLGHGNAADAAWSPVPTAATPAELGYAVTVCRSAEAWSAPGGSAVDVTFARTAPVVVAERRGKSYGVVLSDNRSVAICLLPDPSRPGPLASTGGFGAGELRDPSRPTGFAVRFLGGDSETGDGNGDISGGSRTFIYGRTGPDVRSLTVPLRDGSRITATVSSNGWWEAWYPDGIGSSLTQLHEVRVTDATGASHDVTLDR